MFRQQENRGRGHLNVKEKASIVAFTEAGKSISYISRMLNIGEATVVRWQKRYSETGNVERKAGFGRPRKTTAGKKSVPVWAWFSASGTGDFVRIRGKLEQVQYRDILQRYL